MKLRKNSIYLNELKNELFITEEKITVPRISVEGLSGEQKISLSDEISREIPEFVNGHDLLFSPKPLSDTMSIHYAKKFKGKIFDFIHFFAVNLKFGGDSGTIEKKGDTNHFPSYSTEKLLFKSFILPVENIILNELAKIEDFVPFRVFSAIKVDSDEYFHTFALFDEANTDDKNEKILLNLDNSYFPFSQKMYQFVCFAFFSVAMNIPLPYENQIKEAIEVFEPVFVKLFTDFNPEGRKAFIENNNLIGTEHADDFVFENDFARLSESFNEKAKKYFSRYKIIRDDELSLKRWRRIDVGE